MKTYRAQVIMGYFNVIMSYLVFLEIDRIRPHSLSLYGKVLHILLCSTEERKYWGLERCVD